MDIILNIVWTSLFSSHVSVFDDIKIVVLTIAVLTVAVLIVAVLIVAGIKSRRYQMSRY